MLSITVDNLINSAGNLGKAIQYSLSNYSTLCIQCKKLLQVTRKVTKNLIFLIALRTL